MEIVATQAQTVAAANAPTGAAQPGVAAGTAAGAAAGTAAGAAGFFGAILAQLAGTGEGGLGLMQGEADMPLWGLLPEAEMPSQEQDDPQAQLLAMQMLCEGLFGLSPEQMALMQPQQMTALTALAAQAGSLQADKASILATLAEQGGKPEQMQQGEKPKSFEALFETLNAAWGTTQKSAEGKPTNMNELLRFQTTMQEVRQALSDKPKGSAAEQLNIEALQSAVDDRRFLTASQPEVGKAVAPSFEELAEQVKTGILQNVKQGKSEFVIRLKPEGMGEITIKLSEEKDKITLSIVTSSAAVGKLISNEVNALQNALRPLHAEVKEITVITPPESSSNAAQTAMANDTGNGRQFAGRNREEHSSGFHSQADERFENSAEDVLEQSGINILV